MTTAAAQSARVHPGKARKDPPQKATGWEPVFRVVRRIPEGRVATYGQIAALAGMPRAARQVGWALNSLRGEGEAADGRGPVPWHRVINARGEISRRGERIAEDLQRALLEAEGVAFSKQGRVDLNAAAWKPRVRAPQPKAAAADRKKHPAKAAKQRKRNAK